MTEEEIKLLEAAAQLIPEIYKDGVKPTVQLVGETTTRTAKMILSPLRGVLWGWEKLEGFIEAGMEKRLEKIPEKSKQYPDPTIAVPLIQALSYTAQNETLRETYFNLLGSAMDSSKNKVTHPSFVNLIKQMNDLDIKTLDKISESKEKHIHLITPKILNRERFPEIKEEMPQWFLGWEIPGYDVYDVSACITRLQIFGLLEIQHKRTPGYDSSEYDKLIESNLIHTVFEYQKEKYKIQRPIKMDSDDISCYINEYGIQFLSACRNKKSK